MLEVATTITTILTIAFGIALIVQNGQIGSFDAEREKFKRELDDQGELISYIQYKLDRTIDINEALVRSESYYSRRLRETEKLLKDLTNDLTDIKFDRDRLSDTNVFYLKRLEDQERLIQLPLSEFYSVRKVQPIAYQFTARRSDIYLPDIAHEKRIRKELSEAIASTLKIKLVESTDDEGPRKDAHIKLILKQLDYEI